MQLGDISSNKPDKIQSSGLLGQFSASAALQVLSARASMDEKDQNSDPSGEYAWSVYIVEICVLSGRPRLKRYSRQYDHS